MLWAQSYDRICTQVSFSLLHQHTVAMSATAGKESEATDNGDQVTLDPDYQSEHADLKIITSDLVAFRVDSYRLRAYRQVYVRMNWHRQLTRHKVFDNMITSASPGCGEVNLTDSTLENSKTFKAFLDLVSRGTIPPTDGSSVDSFLSTGTTICDLATFLTKYECHTHLGLLRLTLLEKMRGVSSSWSSYTGCTAIIAFVVGAESRDTQLCAKAIDCLASQADTWNATNVRDRLAHGVVNRPLADFRTLPLTFLVRVPPEYLLAALRAQMTKQGLGGSQSAEFQDMIKECTGEQGAKECH